MNQSNKEETRQRLGNIAQIRDLLFGEQIEQYEQKFVQFDSRVDNCESSLIKLKEEVSQHFLEMKNQIEELNLNYQKLQASIEEQMNTNFDSLDKKVNYLSVNTYAEINNLNQEIKSKTSINHEKIELVASNLNAQLQSVKNQSSSYRSILEKDINSLKEQLAAIIENNLSELEDTKISKSDLAEVLFQMCLKVKGSRIQPEALKSEVTNPPPPHNKSSHNIEGEILLLEEINT